MACATPHLIDLDFAKTDACNTGILDVFHRILRRKKDGGRILQTAKAIKAVTLDFCCISLGNIFGELVVW